MRKIAILVLSLAWICAGSARAQTTTVNPNATITVSAGQLNISVSGTVAFNPVTLNGTNQSATCSATPLFTLTDATGSGLGWHVTVASADFSDGAGHTIDSTGFTLSTTAGAGTITTVAGNTAPVEQSLTNADLKSTPRTVLSAAAGTGMGRYTYQQATAQYGLVVPAATFAASYTAQMTVTIASGP